MTVRRRDLRVDGSLLQPGNRLAARKMAEYALRSVREDRKAAEVRHDDALDWLEAALEAIASGAEPNVALGWSQGRRGAGTRNTAWRDFNVRCEVQRRMREHAESFADACRSVSVQHGGEVPLSEETVRKIASGVAPNAEIELPSNLFPLQPDPEE